MLEFLEKWVGVKCFWLWSKGDSALTLMAERLGLSLEAAELVFCKDAYATEQYPTGDVVRARLITQISRQYKLSGKCLTGWIQ
jgi:hypothetical protein